MEDGSPFISHPLPFYGHANVCFRTLFYREHRGLRVGKLLLLLLLLGLFSDVSKEGRNVSLGKLEGRERKRGYSHA